MPGPPRLRWSADAASRGVFGALPVSSRASAVALAVVLLIAGAAAAALRAQFTGTPAVRAKTSGHDALGPAHAWVDGRRAAADVEAPAVRPRATGIRDVTFIRGRTSGTAGRDRGV